MRPAVRDLTRDLLMVEARGDAAGARRMLERLAVARPEVQKALDRLGGIPTDIEPVFVTADAVAPEGGPAFARVEDVSGLARVLLIGDSISIGYTPAVRELLRGKANVHRIPVNGGPTINGLAHLAEWLGSGRWDVIHFNWGLHDLRQDQAGARQVPLEQYERNLRELVGRLKQTGARLIWASTTPVPVGDLSPPRVNSDVEAYNAAARRIMEENGVGVNDLYGFALPRLGDLQLPANVHFNEAGSRALAEKVAAAILTASRRDYTVQGSGKRALLR
jgi:acyl-CoA thioesterase-1